MRVAPVTTCRLHRNHAVIVQASGKGFGAAPEQPRANPDEVQQAVKSAGRGAAVRKSQSGQPARSARPVNPQEAAKGKLDFVKVKDWGSGQPEMLGNLKVQRLERVYTGAGGSAGTKALDAAGSSGQQRSQISSKDQAEVSFYDQLAREVALSEKRGCLAVTGGPSLPLEQWSFTDARYLQYLTDCLAVHGALDSALQGLTTASAADAAAVGSLEALSQALTSLSSSGLGRADALRRDMQAIAATPSTASSSQAASHQTPTSLEAGQMAKSYAAHITRLGRDVRAGVTAASADVGAGSAAAAEAAAVAQEAAPKLLAQVFVIQLVHLAGGMRFGAAAVDKMGLFGRRAIAFYHDYPATIKEPLRTLQDAMNAAGSRLSEAQRQAVLEELPRAMRSASLLMEALAHAD